MTNATASGMSNLHATVKQLEEAYSSTQPLNTGQRAALNRILSVLKNKEVQQFLESNPSLAANASA